LKAFTEFSNRTPNQLLWTHSLHGLTSDAPDVHNVQRRLGDEIFLSQVQTSGYAVAYRSRAQVAPASPVSIGLVREGEIEILDGKRIHRLKQGDVYVTTSSQNNFVVGPSVSTRLVFAGSPDLNPPDSVGELFTFDGTTPMGKVLASTIGSVEAALQSSEGLRRTDQLNQIAKDVFHRVITADRGTNAQNGPLPLRERLRGFILENLSDSSLTPAILADFASMSRASLFRELASEGGVMNFVVKVRLDVAKSLLMRTGNDRGKVNEVAYLCGFKSPAHFSTAFKRAYGIPPSALSALETPGDMATSWVAFGRGSSR
jgi:AraC-like DNA-binding protein